MDIVSPFSKTLICLRVSFLKGGREREGVKLWHKQHPLPTFMVQQLATYCHLQKQTEKQSKNSQTADMLQCGIFFCCGIKIQWHLLGNALTLAPSLESQDPACLRCLLISLPRYMASVPAEHSTLLQSLPVPVTSNHIFVHTSTSHREK